MLNKLSDRQLANEYRRLRAETRPVFNELSRRGFAIEEKHGRSRVPVNTFENIFISKPTIIKL